MAGSVGVGWGGGEEGGGRMGGNGLLEGLQSVTVKQPGSYGLTL